MAANPSSTPIAPQGMGPRSAFTFVILLLGLGAFYWLTHDPNVLDAYSDLKRTFGTPPPAVAPAPAAPAAAAPALPEAGAAGSGVRRDEEQIRKKIGDEMEQRHKEIMAKLEKDLAEAQGGPATGSPDRSALALIADPDCAPIGRQWLVSGHIVNSSGKAVASRKLKVGLVIDGVLSEEKIVEVGPFKPRGMQKYEVLFRPDRYTRHLTVTATASWER